MKSILKILQDCRNGIARKVFYESLRSTKQNFYSWKYQVEAAFSGI